MGKARRENADDAVEQSRRVGPQDIDPDIARDRLGYTKGHKNHDAKWQCLAGREGAKHCQNPAQRHRDRGGSNSEYKRCRQRTAEPRVGEQPDVIAKFDIFRLAQPFDVKERQADGLDQRINHRDTEQDQHRRDQQPGRRRVLEPPPAGGKQLALPTTQGGGTLVRRDWRKRSDGLCHQ